MTRLPNRPQAFKGEITVFLSIVFILFLSFVGAMLEGVTIQLSKSIKQANMQLALESVFAEYEPELFEKYGIFGRTGNDKNTLISRLSFYGVQEQNQNFLQMQLLSDDFGQEFYRQALKTMGTDIDVKGFQSDNSILKETKEIEKNLNQICEAEQEELPAENNPIETVKQIRRSGLLALVLPKEATLSEREVDVGNLPSHKISKKESSIPDSHQMSFVAYLTKYFPDYTKGQKTNPLAYEAEYLLIGEGQDTENLEKAAQKIVGIRFAINYAYLLTDTQKQAEAETVALGLTTLFTVPGATTIVKQAILAAWAYGESVVDARTVFCGKKIPLGKTRDTWQLELENLARLGTENDETENNNTENGVGYSELLKGILMTVDKEVLSMRALDLIQLNLGIPIEQYVTGIKLETTCILRRNIKYTFQTEYQYQ